jgi:phthiocerol/phenolphthiocerol synthesis type-I polyketide synthase E
LVATISQAPLSILKHGQQGLMIRMLSLTENTIVQSDPKQQITQIWESLLGVSPIAPNQNYFDLGGDSILAVQMFAQIEKVFRVKLPVATLFDAPTIEDLVQILSRETPRFNWSSLVAIQPKGTRPPFFCMHGAGGNVLIYRELSKHLGEDQPFYGLQSQGLDGTTAPLATIEEMASVYVKEIRQFRPRGPYYLGGYCSGGTIAYEVAQQLRSRGEEVRLLAMFDTLNWHKVPRLNLWRKTWMAVERIIFHALNFARLNQQGKSEFLSEKMQSLRNRIPVWKGMLLAKMRRANQDTGSKSLVLGNLWAANDRACMAYVPKPYHGVVTDFQPYKQYGVLSRPDLKWEKLALGGQDVVQLPVYPAGMLVEPFVESLASALKNKIDSAIASQR